MAGKPENVEPQRILLVTGMLGAGKTTVLRELEDLGWEALDNFPVRFLRRLIGKEGNGATATIRRWRSASTAERAASSQRKSSPASSSWPRAATCR